MKIKFVKLWDLSRYFERTTPKTSTCQKSEHNCANISEAICHARFMELVNTAQNFLFLFLNPILSDSAPDKFAKIWVRSMKFETVRVHFLRDVFGLLSSINFDTMATWRNDFSSLLGLFIREKIIWGLHRTRFARINGSRLSSSSAGPMMSQQVCFVPGYGLITFILFHWAKEGND